MPDIGNEGGCGFRGQIHLGRAPVRPRGDPWHTEMRQGVVGMGQQREHRQQGIGGKRQKRIQFEFSRGGGHSDFEIVREDAHARLLHHFGDDRIDLTRHDAGAGLDGR